MAGVSGSAKRSEFRSVEPDDLPALREWTEGICRGSTVEELAELLGVEPKRPALYAFLTRGVPDSAIRRVMREAAKRELDQTEGPRN